MTQTSEALGTDPLAAESAAALPKQRRGTWLAWRLGLCLLTLFVVSILVFLATQGLPGNAAQNILGRDATPENMALLEARLGLDRPLLEQYGSWLGGVLTGDLGTSVVSGASVAEELSDRIGKSVLLILMSAVIGVPLALLIGIWAAARKDSAFDHGVSGALLTLAALPEFVVGLVLITLLATGGLQLFPSVSLIPPGESPLLYVEEMVLPVATLTIALVPYLARLMRASMVDVLGGEYVQMARLKGLSVRRVLFVHAVPNALVPAIQGIALTLAYLAGGIVVVETVFAFPGIGSGLSDAVRNRDLPMIQASVLFLASVYVVVNLIADLLSIYATPRLRKADR